MIDFRNQDCMEGMKEYPDKYFDLAIVDPPYGDGGGSWKRTDRSRFGGRFDNYRMEQIRRTVRPIQDDRHGRAEHGRQSMEKNHNVGHSPREGIFRRTFPCLT